MKDTFRVMYRHGGIAQTCVVDADDVGAALVRVVPRGATVRDVTMRCHATTTRGERCAMFSHDDYCGWHKREDD